MGIKSNLAIMAHKAIHKAKDISPQLGTAVGIIGFFGSAILVYKATRKVEPILEDHKKDIEAIKEDKEAGKLDEKQARTEYTKAYVRTGKKLGKLYLPAGLAMIGSTTCVISSTNSLTKRLGQTTAALAVLDEKFKKAESRTIEKYGNEVADEIFYGIKKELVPGKEIDSETGEAKDILEEHVIVDEDALPLFTEFFDSSSREFEKGDPFYNGTFLRQQLESCQHVVDSGNFITYNEIRDLLGYNRMKDEYGMDWGYSKGDTIDWGLDDCATEADRRFLNGYEDVFLLRFKGMHPIRKDLAAAYKKKI